MILRLNIGCGADKKEGYINIDVNPEVSPDLIMDIKTDYFPYEAKSVQTIVMLHCLEHLEYHTWDHVFMEFNRILKDNGGIILAYPEFSTCARYFLSNFAGKRHYWRSTLYGLQYNRANYHVSPVDSNDLKETLESYGFYRIKFMACEGQTHDTVMVAFKDPSPINREQQIAQSLGLPNPKSLPGEFVPAIVNAK